MLHLSLIGGFITRTMQLSCSLCVEDVAKAREVDMPTLIKLKSRGGLKTPSEAVFRVCLLSERVIRSLLKTGFGPNFPELARLHSLSKIIESGHLSLFSCAEHASSVVREIINRYVRIRAHHEAVLKMDANTLIRSKMTRLPIFSHV